MSYFTSIGLTKQIRLDEELRKFGETKGLSEAEVRVIRRMGVAIKDSRPPSLELWDRFCKVASSSPASAMELLQKVVCRSRYGDYEKLAERILEVFWIPIDRPYLTGFQSPVALDDIPAEHVKRIVRIGGVPLGLTSKAAARKALQDVIPIGISPEFLQPQTLVALVEAEWGRLKPGQAAKLQVAIRQTRRRLLKKYGRIRIVMPDPKTRLRQKL